MIKKYTGFLFEKLRANTTLLLETYLFGSSDFLNRLKFLSKEKGIVGQIAQAIYEFIDNEVDVSDDKVKQNFFDVTDKEGMVSFLMQNRLPKGWDTEENDPSLPYTTSGRSEIKVSKIIKYIIELMRYTRDWNGELPKDKDIETFVNAYKSTKSSSNMKFKMVKGDDISRYYNQKRYLTHSGSLGGSCMSEEEKSIFKLYSKNEAKVSLLILIDEDLDKISGRALVWKLKTSPCEAKYFMDRVYTNNDSDFFKFKQYAEENEFLYKAKMNSYIEDNVKFRYKGNEVNGVITVKLDGDFREYPFVDTLCFLSSDEKTLSNVSSPECFILHSLSGEPESCDTCDGEVFICDDCQNNSEIECPECEYTGEVDGKKCKNCKGTGMIECEHPDAEICSECGLGHKELLKLGIETDLVKKFKK